MKKYATWAFLVLAGIARAMLYMRETRRNPFIDNPERALRMGRR